MTELSFLVELLLNHKLPKATKDLVAGRIKDVEERLAKPVVSFNGGVSTQLRNGPSHQAASTLAILERNPDLVDASQPTVIAQTPATMAAMNSRAQAIAESIAGKTDKLAGRPRKF